MSNILTESDFWNKVDRSSTNKCWNWIGQLGSTGYGKANYQGKRGVGAHRVAWFLSHGSYPKLPLTIDHLCRNRRCVNPCHLELVTNRENILRGYGPPANNHRKTHCLNGHPFSGKNLLTYGGYRICRTCHLKRTATGARQRRRKRLETPVVCKGCGTLFVRANTKQVNCSRMCYLASYRNSFASILKGRIGK